MDKSKNYWAPVFEEFTRLYTGMAEETVDWYPSGQMEITVKIRNGRKYIYDWYSKMTWPIKTYDDECEETEEEWRRRFGRTLNRKMRRVCMYQDQLSEVTGISKVTLSKYMNGKASPSGHNISKLAKALNCSPSELMCGD